ncbi:MAG: hypothetical protein CMD68_05565 [Gammaproteobacteria bacterium]|nr:hypothetical protein [Gammaproteobacteria bacterium]|tara:strand:+ start:548 stop:1195 length:648 start_codon:yes stop_codon:yes gene_type:complete
MQSMVRKISALKQNDNSSNHHAGGLFLGIVFICLLIGIFSLSIWVYELSKKTGEINSNLEYRLSILEEQLQLADSTSTEFLSDVNSQLQFLDKEIRKLWDLSNKRNKVNIENLTSKTEKHAVALKEIALTQTNDQKNINLIKNQSQKLKIMLDKLSDANQENSSILNKISELNKTLLLLEETVQAFDAYRMQNNELIQEMQLQISNLKTSEIATN